MIVWIKWIAIISISIAVSFGIATIYGGYQWQSDTERLRAKLTSGQWTIEPKIYAQKEIEDLPDPVQRFFKTVLNDGQQIVAAVIEQISKIQSVLLLQHIPFF